MDSILLSTGTLAVARRFDETRTEWVSYPDGWLTEDEFLELAAVLNSVQQHPLETQRKQLRDLIGRY